MILQLEISGTIVCQNCWCWIARTFQGRKSSFPGRCHSVLKHSTGLDRNTNAKAATRRRRLLPHARTWQKTPTRIFVVRNTPVYYSRNNLREPFLLFTLSLSHALFFFSLSLSCLHSFLFFQSFLCPPHSLCPSLARAPRPLARVTKLSPRRQTDIRPVVYVYDIAQSPRDPRVDCRWARRKKIER